MVILLEPDETELSHLTRVDKRGFWLAVLPFDSSAAQRAALAERVDHLVLAHRDHFSLLVRDLTEVLTCAGWIATDFADVRTVLHSGQGISHYHSGAGVLRLDTGNMGSYLSDAFDQHFPHDRLGALSVLSVEPMTSTIEDFEACTNYFGSKHMRGYLACCTRDIYAGELMRVGCFVVQEARLPPRQSKI